MVVASYRKSRVNVYQIGKLHITARALARTDLDDVATWQFATAAARGSQRQPAANAVPGDPRPGRAAATVNGLFTNRDHTDNFRYLLDNC